jgi:hypothetical protein
MLLRFLVYILFFQGTLPAGVDQRYLTAFLAREIDRAAERARDTSSSSSSSRAAAPSGAALLQAVLARYGQLLGVAHCALAGHRLAELQQEGLAGTQQVRVPSAGWRGWMRAGCGVRCELLCGTA